MIAPPPFSQPPLILWRVASLCFPRRKTFSLSFRESGQPALRLEQLTNRRTSLAKTVGSETEREERTMSVRHEIMMFKRISNWQLDGRSPSEKRKKKSPTPSRNLFFQPAVRAASQRLRCTIALKCVRQLGWHVWSHSLAFFLILDDRINSPCCLYVSWRTQLVL